MRHCPGMPPRTMKKVAIVQSNYLPWKGYFDLVNSVDEFILYDDMQFTRRDWRNRNLVKTPRGMEWLTIPVIAKGRYLQNICDTWISDLDWGARHWLTLVHNYSKAPFFELYRPILEPLYRRKERRLSGLETQQDYVIGRCRNALGG
jgi:WbqC-like protein